MKRLVVEYNYGGKKIIPSNELLEVQKLEWISVQGCDSVEEVFEAVEAGKDSGLNELPFVVKIPELREVELRELGSLKYIWKSKPWMVLEFPNLTKVNIDDCKSLEHVFTSSMVGSLLQLQHLRISLCNNMEVIVKEENVDLEEEGGVSNEIIMLPRLRSLKLEDLPSLKGFCLGKETFSCPSLDTLEIKRCEAITVFTKGDSVTPKLREVELRELGSLKCIWKSKPWMVLEFPNLTKVTIDDCKSLECVFTSSMVGSLLQLQELFIGECKYMEVIVKEENVVVQEEEEEEGDDAKVNNEIIMLPRLKSLILYSLPSLKGFCLGKEAFSMPLLDTLKIMKCPAIRVFTKGHSATPQLKVIHTTFGRFEVREDQLNSFINTKQQETPCSSLDGRGWHPTTSEGIIRWSFNNLIEIDVKYDDDVEQIIPSKELLQVQNLERIHVYDCDSVKEVFEAGKDSGLSELPFVVKIPKLREVELEYLKRLKYIWKSNSWMVVEFPNLTKVYIHECKSLEHVFSSSMVGSLLQLEHLHILNCASMEVIVKEANFVIEDEEGDAKVNELMLVVKVPKLREMRLEWLDRLKYIWKSNPRMVLEFPNLTKVTIYACGSLEHVFSSSMVGSLLQLQELFIGECMSMEVIVKEEEEEGDDAKVNNEIIMLPRLKSLQLQVLPRLKGCYLGKEAFSWPSLDTLEIKRCPAIRVFTKGHSATPQLKVIHTSFGMRELKVEEEEDQLNSFINTKQQEGLFEDEDEDEDEDEEFESS